MSEDLIGHHFEAAGVRGWLHARRLGAEAECGWDADEPVVLASVVKVPLVLEFARQVAAGQLDPRDRVRIGARDRLGGTGTAGCADDVELSLRDAAYFAMTVSDNTAADVLCDRVGLDNVRSLVRELGLVRTRIAGAPRDIVASMIEDAGGAERFAELFRKFSADRVLAMRALDPGWTNASTPREMTALLEHLWSEPGEAAARVRQWMGQQVFWSRLGGAFGPEVRVSGKTGTLPCIRNEIGVVEYPDGTRFAVAVFTRSASLVQRQPAIEQAIGAAAAAAVGRLRGESDQSAP
ncbi:serine hydrolase [Amycolatopsis albispora]|uniref:serine hydrolase n=1 Tax=Amycolatopsis albispora TaxID=1804986 RepID=UPI001F3D31B1|nr:serine hydrolase [Amycolatopsis albispora]